MKSVWRQRKAGVWRTSTAAATDVGQHGEARLAPHLGEDREPALHPDAAVAAERGPVRLVEGRLVDEPEARPRGHGPQALGVAQRRVARLDHAGSGDQRQRGAAPDRDRPDADAAATHGRLGH
jgi:hypothetical protein